jgi:hypothetical protein
VIVPSPVKINGLIVLRHQIPHDATAVAANTPALVHLSQAVLAVALGTLEANAIGISEVQGHCIIPVSRNTVHTIAGATEKEDYTTPSVSFVHPPIAVNPYWSVAGRNIWANFALTMVQVDAARLAQALGNTVTALGRLSQRGRRKSKRQYLLATTGRLACLFLAHGSLK